VINETGAFMKSKTVIAMAVAGALAVPLGTLAYDRVEVRTPMAVNEAGDTQVRLQDERFVSEHAFADERSWEVPTPLSVNEAGPAESWSGYFAHETMPERESVVGIPPHERVLTPLSPNETSAYGGEEQFVGAEHFVIGSIVEPAAPAIAESERDTIARANQGIYSEYYLIGVPEVHGPDYLIMELEPSPHVTRQDVTVFIPR
jgi:hypothetical protein